MEVYRVAWVFQTDIFGVNSEWVRFIGREDQEFRIHIEDNAPFKSGKDGYEFF